MRILFLLTLLIFPGVSVSDTPETLVWNNYPLKLSLPVGRERIISFEKPTTLDLPRSLLEKIEYSILNNTHYYLKAKEAFPSHRIFAVNQDGVQIILDMTGSDHASDGLVSVLTADEAQASISVQKSSSQASASPRMSINDHYIRMGRFAAQSLYAPERLLPNDSDLIRVKVFKKNQKILKGQPEIDAKPLAQWYSRSTGLHITAIELTNNAHYGVSLDPRNIRGQFYASFLQHGYLTPVKTAESVSALYVISRSNFYEALGPWATK